MLINFADCPDDPIEALLWLSGVKEEVRREVDARWQETYFRARLEGRLDTALALRLHSKKQVLAWTRAENESRGRVMARWGDGF